MYVETHEDSDRAQTDRLLGHPGKHVLGQVRSLVQRVAQAEHWPLKGIEVRHVRDGELPQWEYVLLVLVFGSSFEEADFYLQKLYVHLDTLADKLDSEERNIFQRLVFFDVATT